MNWNPILNNTTTNRLAFAKLAEIKNTLLANLSSSNQENLFGGDLGVALFFFYYYKLTQDVSNLEVAENLLSGAFEGVENNPAPLFSFAGGISGLCWATEFVHAHNFVEVDAAELFVDIDPLLSNYMFGEMHRGHYDYMHGSLGAGLYFLRKNGDADAQMHVAKLIDQLSEVDAHGKQKWQYQLKDDELQHSTNFGLSHGVPSILVFLLKAYQADINTQKAKALIDTITAYLVLHRQDPDVHQCYYAYSVDQSPIAEEKNTTRLAWCYGDLGVCCALWQVAQQFDNATLKAHVIEIMTHAATRRDLTENSVYDAGLCHGASGIAHIFNRFYQATNNPTFKEAALYWFEQTLQMDTFADGLAGYKACVNISDAEYENCTGLLEGIAGTGLALIAAVADFEPNWDECLLIS